MEKFNFLLVAASLVSIFIAAIIIFEELFKVYRIRSYSNKGINTESKNKSSNLVNWIFRNGIPVFRKLSKTCLSKFNILQRNISEATNLLRDKNIETNEISLLSIIIAVSIFVLIFCSILFWSPFAGLAMCGCLISVFVLFVKNSLEKKEKAIRNQIPETLRFMSSCFKAGYTIFQTFTEITKGSKGDIKALFKKSCNVLQTGGSVSKSLEVLKKSTKVPELSFIALALDVQHQTGGNMQPVLDSAKDMAENKIELLRMLDVKTAQAKLSARIVIVLPFALLAIFSIVSPGFLNPFFESAMGIFIFVIATLMQAAGIIIVKNMLKISV